MIEFFQTKMGRAFFDGTMPRLVKALERIATQLEPEAATKKQSLWDNDHIQFARLLDEITATHNLDLGELSRSMDLPPADITKLLQRASKVWEAVKEEHCERRG